MIRIDKMVREIMKPGDISRNGPEIVEILDDDDDEDVRIGGPEVVEIKDDDEDEEEASFGQPQVFLAKADFLIVGIRYYRGVAHPGEFVYLVREPHNPYDRNAVRVDNLHHEKIGHIKKEMAARLAPLMDSHPKDLQIEATIPRKGNSFQLPVSLEFHATSTVVSLAAGLASALQAKLKHYASMAPAFGGGHSSDFPSNCSLSASQMAVVQTQNVDWKHQEQQLDEMFEKQLESQLKNLPELDMPTAFRSTLKLFDYQKQGIRYLVQKERNPQPPPFFSLVKEQGKRMHLCEITQSSQVNPPPLIQGCILCDEMGLGKSLQALGLILLEPKVGIVYQPPTSDPISLEAEIVPIPPMSRIQSANGSLLKQVLKAAKLKQSGKKQALVERIQEGLASNQIKGCHFPFSLRQAHPISPTSVMTSNQRNNKCTVIVCPVTVMANWTHQVETHVQEGILNLQIYHGPSRHKILEQVREEQVDILLVSYHTLAADHKAVFGKEKSNTGAEPVRKKAKTDTIFDIPFHRIILDEAHTIRNPKAGAFKAVTSIQAQRRLAITGTPFVNRSQDIYSLLSFLQVEPLNKHDIFQRAISKPLQHGQEIGLTRLRTIMGFMSLRRSKQNIPGLSMVDKHVQLASVEFGNDMHHQVYEALYGTVRVAMQAILRDTNGNSALSNYTNIFEKLLRLRQACCSGLLLTEERREIALQLWKQVSSKSKEEALSPEEGLKLLEKLKGEFTQTLPECGICMEEFDQSEGTILKRCGHVFCNTCIRQVLDKSSNNCPYCRQGFGSEDIVSMATAQAAACKSTKAQDLEDVPAANFGTPPKILALLQAIESTMKPDEKGVIFSQFTTYLDIIGSALKDVGHEFVRIDGSVPSHRRMECIREFTADGGPRFILCSLMASGVGINLSRGNHAFLMDCWWNEAIESQAMDRIHRIDQTRPVNVTKFIMKNSIEERVVDLQQTKSLRAKGTMQKLSENEKRRALLGDLRGLLELGNGADED